MATVTTTLDFQSAPVAPQGLPTADRQNEKSADDEKFGFEDGTEAEVRSGHDNVVDHELVPTDDDMITLRKVSAPLPCVGVFTQC